MRKNFLFNWSKNTFAYPVAYASINYIKQKYIVIFKAGNS